MSVRNRKEEKNPIALLWGLQRKAPEIGAVHRQFVRDEHCGLAGLGMVSLTPRVWGFFLDQRCGEAN